MPTFPTSDVLCYLLLKMAEPVRLSEIVDQIEMQFDEMSSYLDRERGKVYCMPNDVLRQAEEDDEPEFNAPPSAMNC